jgi:hypothetical protein
MPAPGRFRPQPVIRTSFHLSPKHVQLLTRQARLEGVPKAQIVRRILDAHYGLRVRVPQPTDASAS